MYSFILSEFFLILRINRYNFVGSSITLIGSRSKNIAVYRGKSIILTSALIGKSITAKIRRITVKSNLSFFFSLFFIRFCLFEKAF